MVETFDTEPQRESQYEASIQLLTSFLISQFVIVKDMLRKWEDCLQTSASAGMARKSIRTSKNETQQDPAFIFGHNPPLCQQSIPRKQKVSTMVEVMEHVRPLHLRVYPLHYRI
jgi:hypothetical protein